MAPRRIRAATCAESAAAFQNPDFVEVAIHSYRHRFSNVAGDPNHAKVAARLAEQPAITVPTIAIQAAVDGVHPLNSSADHARHFTGRHERRVFAEIGHNPPQDAPRLFAQAGLDVSRKERQRLCHRPA